MALNKQIWKKIWLFASFILSLILLPTLVSAATFKNDDNLNLPDSDLYQDNAYFLTGESHISSVFEKDLFIASGRSTFDGLVNGDLFIIGGQVQISGKVLGDVRVIGGEVTIKGELENDLVVIGGDVNIESSAQIKGQSLFVGGETNFNATALNPVKIISASTNINSEINSELEITTQHLAFGGNARINKGLTYYAPKKATEESGSNIMGQVNFNQITPLQDVSFIKRAIINFVSFWLILKFVTTLLIAFLLAYVFRVFTQRVVEISVNSFIKSLLIGILIFFAAPIIIALLIFSLVGLPIGFLTLILFIAVLIVVPAMGGIVTGVLLRKLFSKDEDHIISFSTVAIGVVFVTFISFVPYLGDITKIILNTVAFGAMMRFWYGSIFKVKKIS